jgi:hypothetical protein
MAATVPECATCTDICSQCVHHRQYQALEEHIKGLNLFIDIIDVSEQEPRRYWLAGKTGDYKRIWMWLSACRLYGWAMLTSVLIHEYGHFLLWEAEHIDSRQGLEAEHKANQYGYDGVPRHLVPDLYWQYRGFFLLSHTTPGNWDESLCLKEYDARVRASSKALSAAP